MTRLTNAMRKKIRIAIIDYRFRHSLQTLIDKRRDLALAIYNRGLTSKERELMASLPSCWLPDTSRLYVRIGAEYTQINLNGSFHHGERCKLETVSYGLLAKTVFDGGDLTYSSVILPVPFNRSTGCFYIIDATDLLHDDYTELKNDLDQLITDAVQLSRQLNNVLAKHNTVEKLLKEWPDVKPFIPERDVTCETLPAIPVADLNAAIGLPIITTE